MQIESTIAIALRCRPYSETSQTVLFYSRDFGKIRGIAKGVMRPQNSFGGPFDALVEYEVLFARRGAGLHVITGAQIERAFPGLRNSMESHLASAFLLEFIIDATADEEPNRDLYSLFSRTLAALDEGGNPGPILMGFSLKALHFIGLGMKLDSCARCGGRLPGGQATEFSPSDGGALCVKCAAASESEPPRIPEKFLRVRAADLRVLHALASSDVSGLAKIGISAEVKTRAAKIVGHALKFVLEKPLLMLKYVFE